MKFSTTALQFALLAIVHNVNHTEARRLGDPSNGNGQGKGLQKNIDDDNNNLSDTVGSNTIPYWDNCQLTQGFDPVNGCNQAGYSTPFITDTVKITTEDINDQGNDYIKTIASSQDLSSMMSTVSSVEGTYSPGAYKVQASATVKYSQSKQISTNSVVYYL